MNYPEKARRVIDIEIQELQRLREGIGEVFSGAIALALKCIQEKRKFIICGVGKSGNIAQKLTATLNSTGATAVNLNVGDALHGDLGVVDEGDLVIMLSYSGETKEMIDLLPFLKRLGLPLVAITGGATSTLAQHADITLDVAVTQEACPLNLAPTSSTTNMLVMCDALAMVLLEARGFQADDFARLHPGGSLGRALLTRVSDVMRRGSQVAVVTPDTTVREALEKMTLARSGAAIVSAADGGLAGVFTHGDFVRAFQKDAAIADRTVRHYMTPSPVTIRCDKLAAEVLATLEHTRVDDIVVVGESGQPVGMVDTQDLTRFKLV